MHPATKEGPKLRYAKRSTDRSYNSIPKNDKLPPDQSISHFKLESQHYQVECAVLSSYQRAQRPLDRRLKRASKRLHFRHCWRAHVVMTLGIGSRPTLGCGSYRLRKSLRGFDCPVAASDAEARGRVKEYGSIRGGRASTVLTVLQMSSTSPTQSFPKNSTSH